MGDIGELKTGVMKKDPSRALQQHPLLSKDLQGARPVPGGAGTEVQCMVPHSLLPSSVREQQESGCSTVGNK